LAGPLLVLVTGLQGTGKSTVAEAIAENLSAAVLAHDWAMSALRPYAELQATLDDMEPSGRRKVGWSILNSLGQLQLRNGRSIVLDGLARTPEIASCRSTAQKEEGRFVLVLTHCSDRELHRSRVEGRRRGIPNWYEFDWDHVERSMETWEPPDQIDLTLDSAEKWEDNVALLDAFLGATS
jgi:predicted kinase